jgi:hypothetical protein
MVRCARIGSVAAVAAMIVAGCGGGNHSGSGTSSPSGTSQSAAPQLDMGHIQTAAARRIDTDQRGQVLQGMTNVICTGDIAPKAGTKFDCSVSAMPTQGADSFTGKATIVLNDDAGKTFSLNYTMANMPLPGQGPKRTLSGTSSSVG